MFHVEHEVEFVVGLAAVFEMVFGDEEEGADGDGEVGLLDEFAGEGLAGGFAELDVAAWEVVIAALDGFAEEDVIAAAEEGSGDWFYVGHEGLGMWRSGDGTGGTCKADGRRLRW